MTQLTSVFSAMKCFILCFISRIIRIDQSQDRYVHIYIYGYIVRQAELIKYELVRNDC